MLASEIIYEIQNLRYKGLQVDDNELSDSMVYSFICNYRATFLRREIDQNIFINSELIQSFWIELEPNSEDVIGCNGTTFKNCLLRSKLPFPKSIQLKNGDAIFYVGTVDDNKSFGRIKNSGDLKYLMLNKYTGKKEKYFIENNYLYVYTTNPALRVIKVQMIAENPKDIIELVDSIKKIITINPFDPYNFEFPLGRHLVESMIKEIINSEYKLLLNIVKEDLNDNKNQN